MNNASTSSKKPLIIVIAIVVIAALGYFYYSGSTPSTSGTLISSANANDQAVGAQVLGILNQVKTLRIDTALFSDPGYQTLRDHTVPIPPQNVGRTNPFAPIPGVPTSGSGH